MSCIVMYEVFLTCYTLLLSRPFSRHSHGADPPGEPHPWGVCHLPWPPYWPVQAGKTRVWPGEQVQAFQRYRRPFSISCSCAGWLNGTQPLLMRLKIEIWLLLTFSRYRKLLQTHRLKINCLKAVGQSWAICSISGGVANWFKTHLGLMVSCLCVQLRS